MSVRCPKCGNMVYTTEDKKNFETTRKEYPNTFSSWTMDADRQLRELVEAGHYSLAEIAQTLGRAPASTKRRMEMHGLRIKPRPTEAAETPETEKIYEPDENR